MNLVLTNNADLSEVLPELSIEQTETVTNVISNMSILNGLYIEHLWFTEQKQNINILYHGHISYFSEKYWQSSKSHHLLLDTGRHQGRRGR